MSMRKPIDLTWRGKKFSVIITMGVIDRLEDHLNLSTLVQRCSVGDVRLSHAAKLIWLLLLEGGAKTEEENDKGVMKERDISYDDVWGAMHGSGDLTINELRTLMSEIFSVIFPQPRKKSTTTGKKKPASKKAKGTRGKNSSK